MKTSYSGIRVQTQAPFGQHLVIRYTGSCKLTKNVLTLQMIPIIRNIEEAV